MGLNDSDQKLINVLELLDKTRNVCSDRHQDDECGCGFGLICAATAVLKAYDQYQPIIDNLVAQLALSHTLEDIQKMPKDSGELITRAEAEARWSDAALMAVAKGHVLSSEEILDAIFNG